MQLNAAQKTELELLIDATSLADVLTALGEICSEKADHLRTNWQASVDAKHWDRAASTVDSAAARVDHRL